MAFGPCARSKAAAAHERLAPERYIDARRRSSVFEASADRVGASESEDAVVEAAVRARREARGLRGAATRAFVSAHPAANALAEAATFVTWTGYLLGRWNVNDPMLMLVDCYVTRALPAELEANARELDAHRQRQLAVARASKSASARALGVGALKTKNFIMDYAQSALIAAVIGFKLTEWWYGAAEERVVGAATLPVPPPPRARRLTPRASRLPDDTGLCPLCRKTIRNPAVLTCSGYVFCFACVHAHVDRYGDCPVSRHRAFNGVDDIRRVYEGMMLHRPRIHPQSQRNVYSFYESARSHYFIHHRLQRPQARLPRLAGKGRARARSRRVSSGAGKTTVHILSRHVAVHHVITFRFRQIPVILLRRLTMLLREGDFHAPLRVNRAPVPRTPPC